MDIKWYKDSADSSTVWPHDILDNGLHLNGHIGLKRSGSTDQKIEIESETDKIDLVKLYEKNLSDSWDKVKLDFEITQKDADDKLENICENVNDILVIITIYCTKTRFEKTIKSTLSERITRLEVELERKKLFGHLQIQAFYILNKDYEQDDFMAYKKGSVLGFSREKKIILEYTTELFGGQIKEKFIKFEGDNKNALYHFEYDEGYPIIYYNTRFGNFTNLMMSKTSKGNPNTLWRDFLVATFISQIYYDLSSRLSNEKEDYQPDDPMYKAAMSLGKMFKKNKLDDILNIFGGREFEVDDDQNSIFQHKLSLGPILEKALENKSLEENV